METLAHYLGVEPQQPVAEPFSLEDITDAKQFAEALLNSREFRSYIINSLALGSIPSAVLIRVMDLAGWTKPPERIEHTGKDGQPIETITEVRRIIVHTEQQHEAALDPRIVH